MRKTPVKYSVLVIEIEKITSMREKLVICAFDTLQFRHGALAHTLLENLGSRQRAAHWMCTRQRVLSGRTAYDVLADGDEDSVWDPIPGYRSTAEIGRIADARMVY